MTAGFRARATKRRPTKVAATPATAAKKSCHAAMAAKRSSTAPPLGERGENAHAIADPGSRQDAGSKLKLGRALVLASALRQVLRLRACSSRWGVGVVAVGAVVVLSPGSGPLSRSALTSALAHALTEQGLGAVGELAICLVRLVEQRLGFLVSRLLRILFIHLVRLGPLQRVVDHADQVVRDVTRTGRFRGGHRRFPPWVLHLGGPRGFARSLTDRQSGACPCQTGPQVPCQTCDTPLPITMVVGVTSR